MSQNNNHAARQSLGSFSKPESPKFKNYTWGDESQNTVAKPSSNRTEKLQFLTGIQMGIVLGCQIGNTGIVLPGNKMLDFNSMSDTELNTHLDRYSNLIDKELGEESNNKSNASPSPKRKGTFAKAIK